MDDQHELMTLPEVREFLRLPDRARIKPALDRLGVRMIEVAWRSCRVRRSDLDRAIEQGAGRREVPEHPESE